MFAVNKYYTSQKVRKRAGLKETGHQTPNERVEAAVMKWLMGRLSLFSLGAVTNLSAASFLQRQNEWLKKDDAHCVLISQIRHLRGGLTVPWHDAEVIQIPEKWVFIDIKAA